MRKYNYIGIFRAFGVLGLALVLLGLLGCRTRKVATTEQKQVQKERIIKYKDSTALFQQNSQTLQLDTQTSQEYEVTVESDKDSVGNSKEVTYTRIRDGDKETIRVSGGKVKISTKSNLSNSQIVAKATLTNTITASTQLISQKATDTTFSHKTRNVKTSYLYLIAIIIVLLVAFYLIRDKLKRFLK
ncbi:hypothetical protein RCZ04_04480 [Capnocytophaga sp. HP1101]